MSASFKRIATIYIIISLLLPAHRGRKLPDLLKNVTKLVQGGEVAALGELPYQIAFKQKHDKDPKVYYTYCGGAIIGKAKILSAAHCFVGQKWKICVGYKSYAKSLEGIYAVAGTVRNLGYFEAENQAQWRRLQDVAYHTDYDYPKHDIAILFVEKPFKYNDYVKPIRMAQSYVDYEGLCLVSGYGEVSYTKSSDSLLKAYLFAFPYKVCSRRNTERDMLHMICTSVEVADIGRVIPPLLRKDHPAQILNNISYVKHPEYQKWISRVMNGWEGVLGEVPYQVALKIMISRRKKLYMTFCGATIISPRKLISAAHCFEEKGWSCNKIFRPGKVSQSVLKGKYAVAGNLFNVGRYSADGPDGQWRGMESVTYPKKYKFPAKDIAVVILTYPFVYTKYIQPIPIASRKKDYTGKCLVSGYGRTGFSEKDQSEVLLVAHLVVFPISLCTKMHGMSMKNYICTSSSFTDVGKGDSGGPLVCANTGDPNDKSNGTGILVGVVCGHNYNVGSFFSRVSRYRKFIASINSVSMVMYKYNLQSCTVIATGIIYKSFCIF